MSKRSSLDPEEQALWDRVIATVEPLHGQTPVSSRMEEKKPVAQESGNAVSPSSRRKPRSPPTNSSISRDSGFRRNDENRESNNLNSHWDRRFKKGAIIPDVSIDLHGVGLAGAYSRLDGALEQAVHQHLRVVLLVTGKARSHDRTSGQGRGAIASVVRDWLAASRHASHISAVRNAHPRHGGSGALYIILKR